jgi:hypothetical protein
MRLDGVARRDFCAAVCTAMACTGAGSPQAVHAMQLPKSLLSRCVQEETINGAYFQACMGDKERSFEWPSVGRIDIEQGPSAQPRLEPATRVIALPPRPLLSLRLPRVQ